MSTFVGMAWIDLVPGADGEKVLAAFNSGIEPSAPEEFESESFAALIELPGGRYRIESLFEDDYLQTADHVRRLVAETGLVSHAFVALNHDEFGAENLVLDVDAGTLRRVYHYFAYPRDSRTGEYHYTENPGALCLVPVFEAPAGSEDPGVLADGPTARATVAERYGVPMAAVDRAATADASAYQELCFIAGPSAHWREALGLARPGRG